MGAVSRSELLGATRNDADGEWKFVQKGKGKSSRSSVNPDTSLDKSAAQAKESHRTFLEVAKRTKCSRKSGLLGKEILQSQLAKARAASNALGDDPAFAKQAADLKGEIARLEKKVAGGKAAGNSSLAHRVEQQSLFVERENKRVVQLRKDVETAQAALIARETDLADE